MAELKKKKGRGLPAIARAREDRAMGRSRWTTQAGLLAAAVIIAGLIAHKVVSGRELEGDRQALLAKQRAVAVTLGPQWFPLRDKLEADVLGASKGWEGDLVDPQVRQAAWRTQPGLYLRMRLVEAKDAASVRAVAADARKDAFAGCLLREPNERGVRGELDGGAFAEQPWNLGQAYAATRILTDDWVNEVKSADEDLRLRIFSRQYDKAVTDEIPLAIEVVKRAQFFLLVLDEDSPDAVKPADGGPMTEEALQLVPHPSRVHLFDLTSGKEILRLLRTGDAQVIQAGERIVADAETRDAMQRQANNCALARRVDEAIAPPPAPTAAVTGK
ncbi:MAG: hypothetical protein ABSE49_13935 [Polyangiaceae bacterium]|jgi:hypothetical protein